MSCSRYRCSNEDPGLAILMEQAGACRWGLADASDVEQRETGSYRKWLAEGNAAGMDYLGRNEELRKSLKSVLPGARSVICAAFVYGDEKTQKPRLNIASYALAEDYHRVLRERLLPVAGYLASKGAVARICVDSAPVAERYWAVKAGIGRIGINGQVYVPGIGCKVLLAEVVTTAGCVPTPGPEGYFRKGCENCRQCLAACPTGALRGDGTIDSRRCLNYLTIEHRGEFGAAVNLFGSVFGCERCIDVCPAPPNRPDVIEQLKADRRILELDADELNAMSSSAFNRRFRFSALSRAGLKGLQRNIAQNQLLTAKNTKI